MNCRARVGASAAPQPSSRLSIGSNDFNADGRGDILWHNASTREAEIWFMNGQSLVRRSTVDVDRDGVGARVRSPWRIVNQ